MEKPHKKLDVWQGAMKSTTAIYKLTERLPEAEKYGLVSQMRRAAISIPCNIAEGAARKGKREFRNFLSMAQGSLSELDTQLAQLPQFVEKNALFMRGWDFFSHYFPPDARS
ncbi:MAG: four helix bundle protein [Deltaproteobacteria bacterium]|nr:four helix bundle protein [Deltaproteobacteria bacterium]